MFYRSGIYSIINYANNRIYIGKSTNVFKRLNQHKRQLKKGIHQNKALQNDFKQHGKKFEFKLILNCHEDEIGYYEQMTLDEALKSGYTVYNIVLHPFKEFHQQYKKRLDWYQEFWETSEGYSDPKATLINQFLHKGN